MEYARLIFWIFACIFMIPFICIAWILLFWLNPEDRDEEDFSWEEDTTQEYYRAA